MHHEFKFGGEKYEITIAKDGQTWLLGDYTASVCDDGRVLVISPDGSTKFAHSAKMWPVFINSTFFIFSI